MVTLFSVFVIMAILPDTTARGGPTQPENMTCVLYAKRLLTCNYDLHDGVDRRNTTCTTCSSDSKGDICEDATSIKCNKAVGKCEYDCDDLNYCDIVHIMKITMDGGEGDSSTSMCRQIITKDYIQPGPVRNLRVAAINNTALRVSWKQPDDRLPGSDPMKYVVNYFTRVKHVKKTKSRDENVEVVLTDLEPWTNYTVTVRSRPDRKGFRGLPQRATNSTLEDAPASGPLIPRNPYSKVAPGVVEVYWSSVPREARRGIIVNYSVHASCCLSQPLYTTDHSATVNITGHSNVTVFVNAATKIGWSKNPSQLRVYRRVLDVQYIDRVHRTDAMLVWVFNNNEGKEPEFVTVSRCFGSQDDKLLQLVKCLAEVNTMRVPGNERTLRLREHVPPKLACAGCDWQYAVSAHVHNVTSPMVWNTPIQNFENPSQASSMTNVSPVITALAVVVAAVVVAVAVTVAVIAVKRNVLCEPFKITMPPLIINDKEEPCTRTVEDDSNDNAKRRPKTPQVLTNTRDVQEDLQRVSLIQEQLLPARMQAERGDEESDLCFLLAISDGSNYKQVTIDTGKSPNQDCFHRGRDRSVPHNSTKKRLIGWSGPALKTGSLSPSNDCSDEVRQGVSQGGHVHPDVSCRRVGSLEEDEGWSSSSDSGVSTYRQVPIEGDLSQSPEDYQPGDSAATDPEDKREDGHDSDQSGTSHTVSSFVPQKLSQSPSFASIKDSSDVPAATAQSTKSPTSTEVKLHCRQHHEDIHQGVRPKGTGTSIPNSFVFWEAA